jgi:hypothetical protein
VLLFDLALKQCYNCIKIKIVGDESMNTNKSRVSLYLTPQLKKILEESSKKRGLSINTIIITLLEKEFQKELKEELQK